MPYDLPSPPFFPPSSLTYLLVDRQELFLWKLQASDLRQDRVPPALRDIGEKILHGIHRVHGHLCLGLQGLEGVEEVVFLAELEDELDDIRSLHLVDARSGRRRRAAHGLGGGKSVVACGVMCRRR